MNQPSFAKPLHQVIKTMNVSFTLRDRPVTIDEITATDGLLPAILKRSERLSKLCFGKDFGITFNKTDKSMLGYTVDIKAKEADFVMIACIYDSLVEIAAGSPKGKCSLNELLYD